jgi:hypothetical protein
VNGAREDNVASLADSSDRAASLAVESRHAEGSALDRLEASRALILAAMGARIRESAPPAEDSRDVPKPLGQRLLELAGRLPIIRTVLAIRGLWRS